VKETKVHFLGPVQCGVVHTADYYERHGIPHDVRLSPDINGVTCKACKNEILLAILHSDWSKLPSWLETALKMTVDCIKTGLMCPR
jgi:hypothetical protein